MRYPPPPPRTRMPRIVPRHADATWQRSYLPGDDCWAQEALNEGKRWEIDGSLAPDNAPGENLEVCTRRQTRRQIRRSNSWRVHVENVLKKHLSVLLRGRPCALLLFVAFAEAATVAAPPSFTRLSVPAHRKTSVAASSCIAAPEKRLQLWQERPRGSREPTPLYFSPLVSFSAHLLP